MWAVEAAAALPGRRVRASLSQGRGRPRRHRPAPASMRPKSSNCAFFHPPHKTTHPPTPPFPPPCRYLGSADAVRKNIGELKDEARGITPARDYIILSGAGEPAVMRLLVGRAGCGSHCSWLLPLCSVPLHTGGLGAALGMPGIWAEPRASRPLHHHPPHPTPSPAFPPPCSRLRHGLPAAGVLPPRQERRRHHCHAPGAGCGLGVSGAWLGLGGWGPTRLGLTRAGPHPSARQRGPAERAARRGAAPGPWSLELGLGSPCAAASRCRCFPRPAHGWVSNPAERALLAACPCGVCRWARRRRAPRASRKCTPPPVSRSFSWRRLVVGARLLAAKRQSRAPPRSHTLLLRAWASAAMQCPPSLARTPCFILLEKLQIASKS